MKSRFRNLDIARGVAALVVTIFHALLYLDLLSRENSIVSSLAIFPFAIFFSGGSAVLFFFVLSGFVLAHFLANNKGNFQRTRWLVSRLLRLYLPVYPVLIAYIWIQVNVLGTLDMNAATWLAVFLDSTLIFGHGGILGVLWSLRWEVIFSVCLPLLLNHIPKRPLLALITMTITSQIGNYLNIGVMHYLPILFVGFFLYHFWYTHANSPKRKSAFFLICLSTAMLGSETMLIFWFGIPPAGNGFTTIVGQLLAIVGAVFLVYVLASSPDGVSSVVWNRILGNLGRISYSLFLVHQPALVIVNTIFPNATDLVLFVGGILLSLALAWIYWLVVERKVLILAKTIQNGQR